MLVVNFECDLARDVRLQVVIDDSTVSRILSGGSICRDGSVWPGVPAHPQRRVRWNEVDLCVVWLCIELSER